MLVDDAHWADEASLGLLLFLAHRLRGRPLLLVVAWQPEEVPRRAPARPPARGRAPRPRARVLALGRLSVADVAELVAARGRDGELGARLHRESGGLPFFVVEYLDALAREDAGRGRLAGAGRRPRAARGAARGARRAGRRRSSPPRRCSGGSFDPDSVRDASGRSDEEVVAALEELLARGVLVEADDGTLDFRHEQERGLVYEGMTLARRRLLHRRAAAALGARGHRERTRP